MAQPTDDALMIFGRFTLQPRRRLLLEAGVPVRVGSRALDLLVVLTERAGEVVGRDELEARIWPHTVVEETSLRVHASQLRKALRDGQDGARYIVNVPSRGYAFVAELTSRAPP
jgi:DNA-binding winged helix-turn-helix (wHTH) protein